jgi:ribosomal protein L28
VAKRKRKRVRPDPVETRAYTDAEGNVLTLRCSLSAATMRTVAREAGGRAAASAEDAWQRRNEILFERLTVDWEIAGLPLTDQKLLLGRYRIADEQTRRWVRQTINEHVGRYLPDLG